MRPFWSPSPCGSTATDLPTLQESFPRQRWRNIPAARMIDGFRWRERSKRWGHNSIWNIGKSWPICICFHPSSSFFSGQKVASNFVLFLLKKMPGPYCIDRQTSGKSNSWFARVISASNKKVETFLTVSTVSISVDNSNQQTCVNRLCTWSLNSGIFEFLISTLVHHHHHHRRPARINNCCRCWCWCLSFIWQAVDTHSRIWSCQVTITGLTSSSPEKPVIEVCANRLLTKCKPDTSSNKSEVERRGGKGEYKLATMALYH